MIALARVGVGVLILALWWAGSATGVLPPLFFGRPERIFGVIWGWFASGEIWPHLAVTLAETISADPDLPPVRVAFVWGSMFSRYGDVFGPSVNLAARMESVARPGTVLVDRDTAQAVAQALPGGFTASEGEGVDLHGIGAVTVHELTRDRSTPLNLGL